MQCRLEPTKQQFALIPTCVLIGGADGLAPRRLVMCVAAGSMTSVNEAHSISAHHDPQPGYLVRFLPQQRADRLLRHQARSLGPLNGGWGVADPSLELIKEKILEAKNIVESADPSGRH